MRAPIEQAWPKLRSRKICNGTGNGFQKTGGCSGAFSSIVLFWLCLVQQPPAPPQGISRKRKRQEESAGFIYKATAPYEQPTTALTTAFNVCSYVVRSQDRHGIGPCRLIGSNCGIFDNVDRSTELL